MRYLALIIIALALLLIPAGTADAYTIQGGTQTQRAYVAEVIDASWLPSAATDAELYAFGPVSIVIQEHHDPYWGWYPVGVVGLASMGKVWLSSALIPGYDKNLGEATAHEWSHNIWFSLGPKWWQKWAALSDPQGIADPGVWTRSIPENFAENAKSALWDPKYTVIDYPRTDLKRFDALFVREWLTLARYVNLRPFPDLNPTAMPSTDDEDELAAAGGYLWKQGIIVGYTDGTFGPWQPLLKRHVALICERAGLPVPGWVNDYSLATRGQVRDSIPGLAWDSERWDEGILRSQLARLLWREFFRSVGVL